eukprot:TRINITY_DN10018_c0_g1_i2.p1 TRINITY_DN10018_c0_g1~~TRINITY_DN10018_c0_g1_i2.p1  ORF type:complete len:354 (-),score=61.53 TRINITY_DN10018_c0_g1_i2:6-1067(-)
MCTLALIEPSNPMIKPGHDVRFLTLDTSVPSIHSEDQNPAAFFIVARDVAPHWFNGIQWKAAPLIIGASPMAQLRPLFKMKTAIFRSLFQDMFAIISNHPFPMDQLQTIGISFKESNAPDAISLMYVDPCPLLYELDGHFPNVKRSLQHESAIQSISLPSTSDHPTHQAFCDLIQEHQKHLNSVRAEISRSYPNMTRIITKHCDAIMDKFEHYLEILPLDWTPHRTYIELMDTFMSRWNFLYGDIEATWGHRLKKLEEDEPARTRRRIINTLKETRNVPNFPEIASAPWLSYQILPYNRTLWVLTDNKLIRCAGVFDGDQLRFTFDQQWPMKNVMPHQKIDSQMRKSVEGRRK